MAEKRKFPYGKTGSTYFHPKGTLFISNTRKYYAATVKATDNYHGYKIWRERKVVDGKLDTKYFWIVSTKINSHPLDIKFKTLADAKRYIDKNTGIIKARRKPGSTKSQTRKQKSKLAH